MLKGRAFMKMQTSQVTLPSDTEDDGDVGHFTSIPALFFLSE